MAVAGCNRVVAGVSVGNVGDLDAQMITSAGSDIIAVSVQIYPRSSASAAESR